jgi:hypothetical protein
MSLATTIANLKVRRDNIAAELADIELGVKGYAPTASGPGINLDHDGHTLRLWEELRRCKELISSFEAEEDADGGDLGTYETQAF